MALSFVAAGTVATGANPTVAVPAGIAAADLLLLVTCGSAAPTAPTGWTLVSAEGAGQFITVYYKYANGSEASLAVTQSGATTKAVMMAYRGGGAFQVVPAHTTGTGTTATPNTLTTTYSNDYVISIYAGANIAQTWTANGSTTARVNSAGTTSVRSLLVADELQAAAGASTARAATLNTSNTWASVAVALIPTRTVYWVGGSGTWSASATTNWADTSGGTAGVVAPGAWDSVVFDNNSNTGTSAFTVTASVGVCQDLTFGTGGSALDGAMTLNFASSNLKIYGSWTNPSSNFSINGTLTGALIFSGTTNGKTITTNGVSFGALPNGITFNGIGGDWTLGSDLTANTSVIWTNGTFSTGNYNVTATSFSYSATGTATINLGSSTITGTATSPVWDFSPTTGLTFNAGTSTLVFNSSSAKTFNGGSLTYYNVQFTSATQGTTNIITGANTFNNLTLANPGANGYALYTLNNNQTINGSLLTNGSTATRRVWLKSDTVGTPRTVTIATNSASLSDIDFTDITGAGAASPITGTRLGNAAGNSGITFTSKTVYWNLAGAQNWSATGWATSPTGTPAVNNFPLPQDTATFTNSGSVTGTITIEAAWNLPTVDMSGRTSAMTLSNNTTPISYGDWKNGTGVTLSSSGQITFSGRNTQTITSNGVSFGTVNLIEDSIGGTLVLADALTVNQTIAITNGTFNSAGYAVSCTTFTGAATGVALTTSGSTFTITGTGSAWNPLTTVSGSPNITFTNTAATARTFAGNGQTYGTLTIGGTGGSTSTLTITGNNTFSAVTNLKTVANTISLGATTQTVGSWNMTSNGTNILTLTAVAATINYTGSSEIRMNYASISNITFQVSGATVTTPYVWYAGANSTNGGGNTGIAFIASYQKAYLLTSGTSFVTPGDWTNSANNIYMIGGGGGGDAAAVSGNNRAAGGGGGGGGYTALSNQTLSGTISYAIGAAGAVNGGTGGNTTWNSGAASAGGGGGGSATTAPSSIGGTGGIGSTYNGGTGGAGSTSTAASTGDGGGGGGGGGGPLGIGGTGGLGFASATAASISGGGGGGNGGGGNGGNGSAGVGGTGGTSSTSGAGGAGGVNATGVKGSAGLDVQNTVGSGGGAGGGGGTTGVGPNNALYGAGGGGGGVNIAGTAWAGGAGTQGMIFIVYGVAPVASPANYFLLF